MPTVVTNANMQEFIEKRTVPAFVPPAAPAAAAAEKPDIVPDPPVLGDKKSVDKPAEPVQARDASGKFVAKAPADAAAAVTNEPTSEAPPDGAVKDPDDDLPERVRKRIGKEYRQRKEAEEFGRDEARRAMAAEARAEAAERELSALRGTKSGPDPVKRDGAPKPEDFKTVAEYTDAVVDWKLASRRAEESERAAKAAATAAQAEFVAKLQKARAEIPDYDEVVADADFEVPQHVQQYIIESEAGPQVGHRLAVMAKKDPAALEKLLKLSPIRAVAELGKLEASLTKPAVAATPPPATPPKVSRAPSPITPLDGGDAPAVQKRPEDMNFQELRAYRLAEQRRKH
jgi:hypothetical protein